MDPAAVSTALDGYGWTSSWRFSDSAEILWNAADSSGNWLVPAFPATFIIDTSTMILQSSSDVVGDAQAANN